MKRWALLLLVSLGFTVHAADEGQRIYLTGTASDGSPIKAEINDLASGSALPCANCHRESGLGTSESGQTIPPVSWGFLGQNQPTDDTSRFYHLQHKRPAYDQALLHRLLTTGIDSRGKQVDPWMPRYQLSEQQTGQLIEYLKTLYVEQDPGVDDETLRVATFVDMRLPEAQRRQHVEFLQGLFGMKNAVTRGEENRKKNPPIQRAPQYEAYRKWELLVWELPADTGAWQEELNRNYQQQAPFVVLTPLLSGDFSIVKHFCSEQQLPCLFPHGAASSTGDYYNFLYRDPARQRRDYLSSKLRGAPAALMYLDRKGNIRPVEQADVDIPEIDSASVAALRRQFPDICASEGTLIIATGASRARDLYQLSCPAPQLLKIMLLGDTSLRYADIAAILETNSNPAICWVTNYDRVLKRNDREIRVSVMTRKFGISPVDNEALARDLYAFGLLSDSIHQLAGTFSRPYLMENIEHMLNSYPNFTYFNAVTGAPYQRAIVGPFKEFCS